MFTRLIFRNPFQVGRAAIRRVLLFLSSGSIDYRLGRGQPTSLHGISQCVTYSGRVDGMKWREDSGIVRPMLATLAEPPLTGAGLIYEPKYDGIRALVDVAPGPTGGVRLW